MSFHVADSTIPWTPLSNSWDAWPATLYRVAKTTLSQRLQTVMDAMGWNQTDLAKASKATKQSVSNWMHQVSGVKGNIEPRFAWNIEDESRFSARWIVYGEGPPRLQLASPIDAKLLDAISKLPEQRKRALALALDLPL